MLKLYKYDLNYLDMFFRGQTSDHYLFTVILKQFSPCDWTVSGDSLLGTGDTVYVLKVATILYIKSFLILNIHVL